MITEFRRFTDKGLDEFRSLLANRTTDVIAKITLLAQSEKFTTKVGDLNGELHTPSTRLEVGQSLYPFIGPQGKYPELVNDALFWSWLSATWIGELVSDAGSIKSEERWIPNEVQRRYYRHLLAGPYILYSAHAKTPEKVMSLLLQEITKPGEVVAQFQATDNLALTNLAELATLVYYDPKKKKNKPGSGGKGASSSRRLTANLNQLKVNVDIIGMKADEILDLLPKEFRDMKDS